MKTAELLSAPENVPVHFNHSVTVWIMAELRLYVLVLPYFFRYKTEFFSFQNNPKDLDPSYKTDLDLWDRLGRVKLV